MIQMRGIRKPEGLQQKQKQEESGQAIEKDFHVASKFWQTIWYLKSSAEQV